MLSAISVKKSYGQHIAVRSVSFEVHRGEVYGLLGPNGAGKSTTIKMLSCLARPDQGQILIDGLDSVRNSREVKRRIGIVPQDIALYEDFSARENLLFFGRLYNLSGKALHLRADTLLERVGLADRGKDLVGGFSGGMKRRINIAAGLMHNPKLLYLDEPTVGIDPQSRRKIIDLIKEFNQDGLTILYTTHHMDEAEELCNRIGIIDHGEIIAEGSLEQLRHLVGELAPIHITLRDAPKPHQLTEIRALAENISVEGEQLTLLTDHPRTLLPQVLATLSGLELDVHHLDIEEPGLESVFLKLTGRRLRD